MNRRFIYSFSIAVFFVWMAGCQSTRPASNARPNASIVATADTAARPVWAAKRYRYNPERTRHHDLVHTRLEVQFDWARQQLRGIATVTLKPHFYPQNQVQLDAKGFDIHQLRLLGSASQKSTDLRYVYDGRVITISLPRAYTREEKFTVRIEYTAKPNELPAGGSEAITSNKGLYFINADGSDPHKPRQIWTQGETESNSAWFPTIDAPNQKTTQEMYITVDKQFRTLSNGRLVQAKANPDGTRTDYWKMDQPHAPYLFMMVVGAFAVVKDHWKGKEVSYYVEPRFEQHARNIFGHTPEMIEFFSNILETPYPWEKYAQVVVRDFVSGAMENTTATVHMEALQVDGRSLLDENWDYIIAHELFHQWFGNLVTLESWANLPLNEAFANYAEYLWNEHQYGSEEADYKAQHELDQYLAEAATKQEPLIRYYYKDREEMFDSHSYAKGGLVLHMLRKYVGDEAFFTTLKRYLNRHKFANVEVHDLRLAFEEVTGEDLHWFFDQWFLSAGHPQLKVEQNYAHGKVALKVTQQQDTLYTPVYRLPLKVDVWVNGQRTRYDITVDRAVQTLVFPTASAPELVVFDAEKQLVGTIDHEKSPSELVFQYRYADKYLGKYDAIARLSKRDDEGTDKKKPLQTLVVTDEAARQMMLEAMNDPFWKIRQLAVGAFQEYNGASIPSLRGKLQSLALKDPRSYVRAEALGTLASLPGKADYTALYRQSLDDRSYTVAATALFLYLATQPPDAAAQVARFEPYDNDNIVLAIAGYYADQGGVSHFPWLAQKLARADGILLYQLTQAFGIYLLKVDAETQKKGAQVLAKIASENKAFSVRFAAFQSLSLIKETEGVDELRKQIKAHETDPRLLDAYESMM